MKNRDNSSFDQTVFAFDQGQSKLSILNIADIAKVGIYELSLYAKYDGAGYTIQLMYDFEVEITDPC